MTSTLRNKKYARTYIAATTLPQLFRGFDKTPLLMSHLKIPSQIFSFQYKTAPSDTTMSSGTFLLKRLHNEVYKQLQS